MNEGFGGELKFTLGLHHLCNFFGVVIIQTKGRQIDTNWSNTQSRPLTVGISVHKTGTATGMKTGDGELLPKLDPSLGCTPYHQDDFCQASS